MSEDEFENVSIVCTEFVILEDKLAFEGVENFTVNIPPWNLAMNTLLSWEITQLL